MSVCRDTGPAHGERLSLPPKEVSEKDRYKVGVPVPHLEIGYTFANSLNGTISCSLAMAYSIPQCLCYPVS